MGEFIIFWLLTIATFIIGYYLGLKRSPNEQIAQIKQKIDKAIQEQKSLPVGPIRRPTPEELARRSDPKAHEGLQEFGKLIKDVILKYK